MEKDLNYWKKNAEEDYIKVPISVLRYITEVEKAVLPQADVISSGKRCPKCNDQGWLYDEEGNRTGTCPCHYL